MASCILIMLWVSDELSYDKFHNQQERIFRLTASLPDLNVHAAVSSPPLAEAFRERLPQVENGVRISSPSNELLQVDETIIEEQRVMYADSNFFQFFTFEMVSGDPKTALSKAESIVMTEEMATKYFGNTPALGKTIRRAPEEELTVTGIIKKVPSNSHMQFDFVIPMTNLARRRRDLRENLWDNFSYYTYLKLDNATSASKEAQVALAEKFQEIYRENESVLKVAFTLQPLDQIHLHSNLVADFPGRGNIQYVYIFTIVAIFILVVACINFMNLATARSARRAREVGLRKVAGAVRFQLVRQFLAESSMISLIALVVSLALVYAALPAFNDLSGKQLGIDILNIKGIAALLVITLITGLAAGSYPAFFLSSFLPAAVLKGNLKAGATSANFRNVMVVIQFTVSIALMVGTCVVFNQLQYIKNKNIGFDKENLIYTRMTGDLWKNYQSFRNALDANTTTTDFAFVSDLPTGIVNSTVDVIWPGKDPNTQPLFTNFAMDENAVDIFKFEILAGRNFSKDIAADSTNLIVNEAALHTMNIKLDDAIGHAITLWDRPGTIVGVVKDFNFQPLQKSIDPLLIRYNTWGGIAVVKAKPQQAENAIAGLGEIMKELNPAYPFSYNFIDQEIDKMYRAEQRLGTIFTVFASLAIFISCLGLYGMSAFLAERRTREIGVRKVLGASVPQVVFLLSKTFTRPIVIAMAIATPLSWFYMDKWLSGFAYHVDLHWSIFAGAFLAALAVALITVSFESIKAAVADPAKSLKQD